MGTHPHTLRSAIRVQSTAKKPQGEQLRFFAAYVHAFFRCVSVFCVVVAGVLFFWGLFVRAYDKSKLCFFGLCYNYAPDSTLDAFGIPS